MYKPSTAIRVLPLVLAVIFLGSCFHTIFPFRDNFSDPSTMSEYRQFDERVPDNYQIADGVLTITASVDQDLWGGYTGGAAKRGAPLLLLDAPTGYYIVEAMVTATNTDTPGGPQALNTQVGLFVFRDIDNWLFYGFTNHDFTIDGTTTVYDGLMVTVTYNGSSSIHHQYTIGNVGAAYLRLKQYGTDGDRFECQWRVNANDPWIMFAPSIQFPTGNIENEEVGMGVKTFDLAGAGVSNVGLGIFDNFKVEKY